MLEATDVVLATGSRVKSLPGITPDGVRVLTSDDVLKMSDLPASIVIVGAGAVGSEFASMFHDFGVKVTLLEYLPAIVPLEDRDVSKELEKSFKRRGIEVMTNARFDPASLAVGEDGIRLMVGPEGGEATEVAADCILVATGRAANVEGIGLETTRITVERGIIPVDGHMRTAEPHVWAIGDIVGGLWLAHTAAHEGLTAVHTIVGDPDVHAMDYDAQPRATYCRPEIASVGLTEQECEKRGLPVKVGKVPFQAIAKALIGGEHEGFAKVIAHAETGATLGVHLVGPARHGPDRRGVARLHPGGGGLGDRGGDAPAPDALGGPRRGGDGRRRALAQLLTRGAAEGAAPERGFGHRDRVPGRARRPVRSRRDHRRIPERPGSRRPVRAAARAPGRALPPHGPGAGTRRAGLDPQPLRPRPLRHLRPGPRGCGGGDHGRARRPAATGSSRTTAR